MAFFRAADYCDNGNSSLFTPVLAARIVFISNWWALLERFLEQLRFQTKAAAHLPPFYFGQHVDIRLCLLLVQTKRWLVLTPHLGAVLNAMPSLSRFFNTIKMVFFSFALCTASTFPQDSQLAAALKYRCTRSAQSTELLIKISPFVRGET